jgi:lysophospholipase L1-like esterase
MTSRLVPSRVATLALIGALAAPAVEAATYDLYYLGGQSNMDGYGRVEELPEDLQGPVEGVRIFHGNTAPDATPEDGRGVWSELRPGHGVGYESDGEGVRYSDRFGVELTFARTLRELDPEARIALVKYSRGGTSLDRAAALHFGSWDPDYPGGRESGTNQYDHFLATLRHATAVGDIDGDGEADTLVPKGIVWMQGEADAFHTADIARRYEAHLTRMMNLMRAALRVDDLPVVIGRISDSGQDEEEGDGRVWNHGDVVRAAQASFVAHDPRAALVTTTDGYGYSDRWHYDSAGYLDLGREFARAVHGLRADGSWTLPDPDPRRFEPEILAFAEGDRKSSPPESPLLFVGSSSIRLWATAASRPGCVILNRGFGGAQISDVLHYYEQVVAPYGPRAILLYAGDNDVWEGKSPTRVFEDFRRFVDEVRRDLPGIPVYFLAIKPSISRWSRWRDMEAANRLVRAWAESQADVVYVDTATPLLGHDDAPREELFDDDALHLSEEGYGVWGAALAPHLDGLCPVARGE